MTAPHLLEELPDARPDGRTVDAALNRARGKRRRRGGHKPTKAELEAELRELRRRAGDDPDAGDAGDAGASSTAAADEAATVQVTQGALFEAFRALGGAVASFARGPWWELTDEEAGRLASAWAPVLAPKIQEHAEKVPLMLAVVITASIARPRIERELARRRAPELAAAVAVDVTGTPADAPAGVVSDARD